MSILGAKTKYDEDDKLEFCPAVLNSAEEISLIKAIFLSTLIHIVGSFLLVCTIAIIMFILQILGLNLGLFQKPEMQMKDIEFVLVNKEDKPINPRTKFRADKSSRGGGKHDPKKMVAAPTAPTRKSAPQKQANTVKEKIEKLMPKKQAEAPKKQVQKQQGQKSQQKQSKTEAPPRPAPTVSMPKPALPSLFSIPIPKNNLPKTTSGGGGGVKSSDMKGTQGDRGGASGSKSPSPVISSSGGASGKGRHSSSYSVGSGSLGNPSGGGGAPGIDALAEPDFGPWMRDLQAKIKRNWDPPRGDQSKRVVLVFTVAKDGRLLRTRLYKSSGSPTADKAAISAVEYSAPFKPLPREFRGSDIDIHFTFDYNVFGGNIR